MHNVNTRQHPFKSAPQVNRYTGAIEWEELPSLADTLHKRLVVRGRADFGDSSGFGHAAWDATMPAALEPVFEPEPFRETDISGLAAREVRDGDLFRHFFA